MKKDTDNNEFNRDYRVNNLKRLKNKFMDSFEAIRKKIIKIIFGSDEELSLKRKIHILISFLTFLALALGLITNIILELSIWINLVVVISLITTILFYLSARNSIYHEKTIVPFFLVSVFLFSFSWFFNAGINGNISFLIFVYFLAMYLIIPEKLRFAVFVSYLIMYFTLVLLQYNYPNLVIPYANTKQRTGDLLTGGLLSFLIIYFIIDSILKYYTSENKKITLMNEELQKKNKEIEETNLKIKESEEKYRFLVNNTADTISHLDLDLNYIYISPSVYKIRGYEAEEVLLHNLKDYTTAESFQNAIKQFALEMQYEKDGNVNPERTIIIELQQYCKDGSLIWMENSVKFIRDSEGKATGILSVSKDITKRREAEELLRKSNERLLMALSSSKQAWFDMNLLTYDIEMSDEYPIMLGYEPEEFNSDFQNWLDNIHPDDKNSAIETFNRALNLNVTSIVEYRRKSKTGNWQWLQSTAKVTEYTSDGRPARMIGTHMDISNRKNTEEIIRISEEKYRILFQNSVVPVGIRKSNTVPVEFNKAYSDMTGYTEEELITLPHNKLIHPDDYETVLNKIKQIAEGLSDGERYECRYMHKNGSIVWIDTHIQPLKEIKGDTSYIMGAFINITERKNAEIALLKNKEENDMLAAAIRNISECVTITDENNNLIFVNDKFLSLYGYSKEEVIGKNISIVRPVKDDSNISEIVRMETLKGSWNGELINRKKDGTEFPIYLSASLFELHDNKTKLLIGTFKDISERKQKELELQESETRFKALHNASFGGIFIHKNGIIFECNQGLTEITGYTYDELIGMNGLLLLDESFRELITTNIQTGNEKSFEVVALKKNGKKYYVRAESKNIPFKGEMVRVVEFRDISEQKKTEIELLNSEMRFKALHNASFGGITIHDKGIILECNQGLSDMTGYSYEELIGMDGLLLIAENSRPVVMNNIMSDYEKPYEIIAVRKSGEEYPARLEAKIIPYKGKIVRVVEFRDITEQKIAENMLQQQNKELEQQFEEYMQLNEVLRQTNFDLEIAKEKAEESDRLKTAFLQNISHEIRTPLNGIIGFTNLLLNKNNSLDDLTEIVGIIQQSGNRLIEIVNNVLELSKIETGQIVIHNTHFSINYLLTDLKEFFIRNANLNKIELNYYSPLDDENSIIYSDESKINQILNQLLNNAIKFTKKGKIDFGYEIVDDNLRFFVKDTGIGIPEYLHGRIFERFTQVEDSISRSFEGAGLGLAICKGLVKILGGTIRIKSEVNEGTTFYFTLPLSVVSKQGVALIAANTQQIKSKEITILIAEDDFTSFNFLCRVLRNNDYIVFQAFNGEEAVEFVKRNPEIDLILMDIRMPEMNGIDATKQIRKIKPDLPIIAQSAYSYSGEKDKILNAGCNDFIAKPVDPELLLKMINKYI